jgi:hypothetical protein
MDQPIDRGNEENQGNVDTKVDNDNDGEINDESYEADDESEEIINPNFNRQFTHQEYIGILINMLRRCDKDSEAFEDAELILNKFSEDDIKIDHDLDFALINVQTLIPAFSDIIDNIRKGFNLGIYNNQNCIDRLNELKLGNDIINNKDLNTVYIDNLIEFVNCCGNNTSEDIEPTDKFNKLDFVRLMNVSLESQRPMYYMECVEYIKSLAYPDSDID